MAKYQYINGQQMAEIIRSKTAMKDYVVVDVRDDDYKGGNIKGSVHSPSEEFEESVGDLVTKFKDVPKVIFHCALSQARGPKAARIYAETMQEARAAEAKIGSSTNSEQEVLALRGGFTDFQAAYRNEADLVENWKAAYWQ